MARRRRSAADRPTPGPWLAHGGAEPDGRPYLIRQDRPVPLGPSLQPLATGIRRLPDARLMAAAPALAATLLGLLIAPELRAAVLAPRTRRVRDRGWALLGRVAPHYRI